VPHGLTGEEFRGLSCNICHLRGGWVARFNTYAPVTPHPEFSSCLQCHVAQDTLVGRPLPTSVDAVTCDQCHIDPDADPETFVELDWVTVAWPETNLQAMPESPHQIPHDFQTRSNCLACHSGPGAVIDLRTDHPERVNCRQCHVQAAENVESFPALAPSEGAGRAEGTS
jgi:cytochrome c-type protein NapB